MQQRVDDDSQRERDQPRPRRAVVLEADREEPCLGRVTDDYPDDVEGEATDREVDRPSLEGQSMYADD